MKKLKLFVWEEVLTDYTDGIMFALAENAEQARELIYKAETGKSYLRVSETEWHDTVYRDLQREPKVYNKKVGYAVWGGS